MVAGAILLLVSEVSVNQGIRRADRQFMADMNRNLVLNILRERATVSRSEIARLARLSQATVSGIIGDFEAINLVREVGAGDSSGGRPPLLLELNRQANFVVGAKLMREAVSVVVTDLRAEVVYGEVVPLSTTENRTGLPTPSRGLTVRQGAPPLDIAEVLDALCAAVEKVIERSAVARERLVALSVGLAGLVDVSSGLCRYSPTFGWHGVAIAEPLAKRLGLPVVLENDVNTLTVAEQWFGHGHGVEHFAVVTVGDGIGAGLVFNGQLYRGADGGSGEIGHMPVRANGPLCACGRRGCLEAVASDPAVLEALRRAVDAGKRSSVETLGRNGLAIEDVASAADAGDRLSRRLLRDSGRLIGLAVAGLVNTLNPQLVVVSGEGTRAGEHRFAPMRKAIEENCFADLGRDLRLVTESVDDMTWARGAACVVLGELFMAPMHRQHDLDWPMPAIDTQQAG